MDSGPDGGAQAPITHWPRRGRPPPGTRHPRGRKKLDGAHLSGRGGPADEITPSLGRVCEIAHGPGRARRRLPPADPRMDPPSRAAGSNPRSLRRSRSTAGRANPLGLAERRHGPDPRARPDVGSGRPFTRRPPSWAAIASILERTPLSRCDAIRAHRDRATVAFARGASTPLCDGVGARFGRRTSVPPGSRAVLDPPQGTRPVIPRADPSTPGLRHARRAPSGIAPGGPGFAVLPGSKPVSAPRRPWLPARGASGLSLSTCVRPRTETPCPACPGTVADPGGALGGRGAAARACLPALRGRRPRGPTPAIGSR